MESHAEILTHLEQHWKPGVEWAFVGEIWGSHGIEYHFVPIGKAE
jgi:hypothetical protein